MIRVLRLHPVEQRQPFENRRHPEHAQQVSGWRRVDDDVVVSSVRRTRRPGAARRFRRCPAATAASGARRRRHPARFPQRDFLEQSASSLQPRRQCGRSVDFHRLEACHATDRAGQTRQPLFERIAERRRRIRRDDQSRTACARGEQPERGRARRLADAALATDEPERGTA